MLKGIARSRKKSGKFFETTYYAITGLRGVERSKEHVEKTAKVINEAKPTFVRNLTITNPKMRGILEPLNAEQQLEELRNLVFGIKVDTYFTYDHVSSYIS